MNTSTAARNPNDHASDHDNDHDHASAHDHASDTTPEKLSGGLPGADERLHDDEDALDEALAESFPASDPVSPGVCQHDRPSSAQ